MGKAETTVDVPDGANALQAIKTALAGEKEAYDNIFDSETTLKPYIIVMRNGANISTLKGLTEPLKDGDHLQVLPMVSGGQTFAVDQLLEG